jgi:hypothetical protein
MRTVASRTMTVTVRRGGRVREKSSANSCVSAPPTKSTFAASRSTSRATRTPSPTTVSRSSAVRRPCSSTATARARVSVSGATSARVWGSISGRVSISRVATVVATVSSRVSATSPPVATMTASLTLGEALPRRLMAPSTSTSWAPWACSRAAVAATSPRVVGPLISTARSPTALPRTTLPSEVWKGRRSSCSMV